MLLVGVVNSSTTEVNAMQDIINQEHVMSKEDLKKIMSNLITDNNTPLTNNSIDFIVKLANTAEQILSNNKMDDLIIKVKNNISQNIEDNYNDFDCLLHFSSTGTFIPRILDSRHLDIYNCNDNTCEDYNCKNCIQLYINFLKKLKLCYDTDKITQDKYRSPLKYLLYLNTFHFCDIYKCVFYKSTQWIPYYFEVDEKSKTELKKAISESNGDTILNMIATKTANRNYLLDRYGDSNTALNKITEQVKRQVSVIELIIEELINTSPLLPADTKLSTREPSKIAEEIKMEILPFVVQGFRDLTYFCNYEKARYERVKSSYSYIFNIENKAFCEKVDKEFNITNKINNNTKYKAYFNKWNLITYYSILIKNRKPADNNKINNDSNGDITSEGKWSLKKVKDNIKKLDDRKNVDNNNTINGYGYPGAYTESLPGPVYETILSYLIHTKKDYKKP